MICDVSTCVSILSLGLQYDHSTYHGVSCKSWHDGMVGVYRMHIKICSKNQQNHCRQKSRKFGLTVVSHCVGTLGAITDSMAGTATARLVCHRPNTGS